MSNRNSTRQPYRIRAAKARARRARQVTFLYGLIAAVMVLIILAACLLRFGFTAQADAGGTDDSKYYTSVMITYDMNAEDYAREYADPDHYASEQEYLREVCSINNLSYIGGELENLGPGNYIIIPYYAD